MEDICKVVDSTQCSQYLADNFLCNFLRVYTVASLGYFLYLAGSRISYSVENPPPQLCGTGCCEEEEEEEEKESPVLYPIENASHDVAAVTEGAFCLNHYNPGDSSLEYIIMMYNSDSSAFVYWCDSTPAWDVLQTTARKYVTENRCAGLYAVQTLITDSEDTVVDGSNTDENSNDGKTLSTCVDNIHVRQGRLDRFRTSEQAVATHAEVNYKNFASMRRRTGTVANN